MRVAVLKIAALFSYCGYALWCFVDGVRVLDQSLHYLGIAVGVAWGIAYLRAARRWALSPGGSSHAGDRASSEPIEPS